MKTSMKELTVFVMMATIVLFVAAATTASASGDRSKTIVGEYGFSGGGTCMSTAINPDGTFIDTTKVSGLTYTSNGVVTFEGNGMGSVNYTLVSIPNPPAWGNQTSSVGGYQFTYKFTDDDVVTLTAVENTNCNTQTNPPGGTTCRDHNLLIGYVSADHKTIEFANPAIEVDTLSFVLPDKTLFPILKLACIYSYSGSRIDK
jgi:hypothetical protein